MDKDEAIEVAIDGMNFNLQHIIHSWVGTWPGVGHKLIASWLMSESHAFLEGLSKTDFENWLGRSLEEPQ